MADYQFYVNSYKGAAISEADWPGLAARAEAVLSRYKRHYRVTAPGPEAEDMAVCAMAEGLQALAGGAVASAQIGSVSVSYALGDNTPKGREQTLYRLASRYLDIYRGKP